MADKKSKKIREDRFSWDDESSQQLEHESKADAANKIKKFQDNLNSGGEEQ